MDLNDCGLVTIVTRLGNWRLRLAFMLAARWPSCIWVVREARWTVSGFASERERVRHSSAGRKTDGLGEVASSCRGLGRLHSCNVRLLSQTGKRANTAAFGGAAPLPQPVCPGFEFVVHCHSLGAALDIIDVHHVRS